MMKLSFGMKAKRQKFATQLADDEEDEEEKELKRLKSERMTWIDHKSKIDGSQIRRTTSKPSPRSPSLTHISHLMKQRSRNRRIRR